MKPCYLCSKRTDDCLFDPPVCRECQRAHELTKERSVVGLAIGTPSGWKTTQTWTEIFCGKEHVGWLGPNGERAYKHPDDLAAVKAVASGDSVSVEKAEDMLGFKLREVSEVTLGPTYNHTREDSPLTPCAHCATFKDPALTAALDLQVAAEGLRSSIKRVTCGQQSEARATHFCTLEPGHGGPHRMEQCEPEWSRE